jgi:uncharacterized protein with NAD-binding domain and iron-sulfur cluster
METSPIITIHLWLNKKIILEEFIGLLNSPIHWIFDNKTHYSIVISAAEKFIQLENEEIFKIVENELIKYFSNFSESDVKSYKVIKEKRATLKCSNINEKLRKTINTEISNLIFAGDWTNTNLPGTIEGSISSGKKTAEKIF